jgi:hypothetical protein
MPTVGIVSGLTFTNNINACNSALLSLYSGATAPASPTTGMLWYNTTTNYIQQYDGASWLNLWYVDATNHLTTPQIGGGIVSASINSAATTDIGSVPQSYVTVNGTVTVTSLGSSAQTGSIRVIKFAAALTLTHNATSLILPWGLNITTAANDVAVAQYMGSGNWRVLLYVPASGSVTAAAAAGYYLDALFASSVGNYYTLQGQSAETKISFGPAADKKIYYDANGHVWRGVGATPPFMQLDSTALAMSVPTRTLASTTSAAGLRVPTGVAPTSPVDGDIWNDGTNANIRIGSTTLAFGVNFATKADQQAGTSAVKAVAPLHQQDHPSAAKAWVIFGGGAGGTIAASYNVTSVSRSAAGTYNVVFTTAFATTNYQCNVTAEGNSTAGVIGHIPVGGRSTGNINVEVYNTTPVGADATIVHVACHGAQ